MPKTEATGVGTQLFLVLEPPIMQFGQQVTAAPYGRGEEAICYESERMEPPQTLVCTKCRRSYHRRRDEYQQNVATLASLAGLAGEAKISADLVKGTADARASA